jgi:hypothetical protein
MGDIEDAFQEESTFEFREEYCDRYDILISVLIEFWLISVSHYEDMFLGFLNTVFNSLSTLILHT